MKGNPIRWTATLRRGIRHLETFLSEDTDRPIIPDALALNGVEGLGALHPMYRRLSTRDRRELQILMRWLANEANGQLDRDDDAAALAAAPGTTAIETPRPTPKGGA